MSFLIAAAGTGGHVYPGLAVGSALVTEGVAPGDVLYVGGDRLESKVYPAAGFQYMQVDIRGLKRSLSLSNVTLPLVVKKAANKIAQLMEQRRVGVALGMGGYVTMPTSMASRVRRANLMVSEQNAVAGLANRFAGRRATRQFVAFPDTRGLPRGEWVGNPVREAIRLFNRAERRAPALAKYGFDPDLPVLGVFGGSLGAAAINRAIARVVANWDAFPVQFLHLTGDRDHADMVGGDAPRLAVWHRIAYEAHMEDFYAASDLVVARAGGSVAELTATGTPAILVPGQFGSAGHQLSNARFLETAGAAKIVEEAGIASLGDVISSTLADRGRLSAMAEAAHTVAKPDAAVTIARAMIESV